MSTPSGADPYTIRNPMILLQAIPDQFCPNMNVDAECKDGVIIIVRVLSI